MAIPEHMNSTLQFYETHAEQHVRLTSELYETEWLNQFAGLVPKQGKVLDAGCGGGRDCRWFLREGFEIYGMDLSPRMVSIAKGYSPGVQFCVMNVLEMAYSFDMFDGIWCTCV